MNDWKDGFLHPLPNGTIVCQVNPYNKTCYFERHTDWGVVRLVGVPDGLKIPRGYQVDNRIKKRRSSASGV